MYNLTGPVVSLNQSMKVNIFYFSLSALFFKLIYYGAGTVVHLLQLERL